MEQDLLILLGEVFMIGIGVWLAFVLAFYAFVAAYMSSWKLFIAIRAKMHEGYQQQLEGYNFSKTKLIHSGKSD